LEFAASGVTGQDSGEGAGDARHAHGPDARQRRQVGFHGCRDSQHGGIGSEGRRKARLACILLDGKSALPCPFPPRSLPMMTSPEPDSPARAGSRSRKAMQTEQPSQVVGAINANHASLARQAGFRAIYSSGGGVAAGSSG
ncbi:hypothetical protein OY671_011261, partial [Metschnikowia pulcherrima]